MHIPVWTVAVLALVAPSKPAAAPPDTARLVTLVGEIRSADYRGDRPELERLAVALDAIKDPSLAAYRSYWQGFARWRRALNGFNETPWPADLKDDLEGALASFRAALAASPDWIEAKVGMVGTSASLLFLAGDDQARKQKILVEFVPLAKELAVQGDDNPRALWLTGGFQLYRGDAVKASETLRKGLDAARREALAKPAAPAYLPTWGGAENLMNLAYLYSHSAIQSREVAMAFAECALVAAPEWHYVREVLMEQIRSMEPLGK